jgi:hypothetical protein
VKPRIAALKIEGFRAFRELEINDLGRVNLITGRNNTGKSSILEALRLLATNGSTSEIRKILHYREEDAAETDGVTRVAPTEGLVPPLTLFRGFPTVHEDGEQIAITATRRGLEERRLTISRPIPLAQLRDLAWSTWAPSEGGPSSGMRVVLGVQLAWSDGGKSVPLESFARGAMPVFGAEEAWIACVHVGPQGVEQSGLLGPLWDRIALSELEREVIQTLAIATPEITGVSMIGGTGALQPRIAIARSSHSPRPLPLRSFGDGLNRLFGIAVSLVNAQDGVLLIDEVENGLHHTVQFDIWRAIFRLARRLDVQVFATSHSWDAVEAFQRAASDDPEDGALVRLTRRGDDLVATVFREEELAIATRDRIEVR